MPISPANMALYPGGSIKSPEWQAIRSYIRARAGDCCEECGVRHLTYGVRIDDEFTDLGMDKEDAENEYNYSRGIAGLMGCTPEQLAKLPPLIRIVCTVAHLDQRLDDHSAANLKFLCQKHHNALDAKSRAVNARATLAAKSGQAVLL